jgi:replicative DNA helicase
MVNATALERQLIGGLLHHPGVIAEKQITAEHFTDAFTVTAFGAVLGLLGEGKQPDPVSTSERMGRLGDLGKLVGDWQETKPANRDTVSAWADSLKKEHRQRALLAALSDAQRAAQRGEAPESIVSGLLGTIGALNASGAVHAKGIKQILAGFIDTVEQRFSNEGALLGIPSGLTDLDRLLLGFRPNFLYILGARPSMGKSALMAQLAVNAASQARKAVGIVSAEMSSEQLIERMVSSVGRIDHHNLSTGKLLDDQWPRLTSAVNILAESGMRLNDKPACS